MSAPKKKPLPFTAEDLAFWRTEIKSARDMRTTIAEKYGWEDNLKRYTPKDAKTGTGAPNAEVSIGADFRDVERKKAALFYDTPEVGLTVTQDREVAPASPEMPTPLNLSTLVSWQQELLNTLLGPQHANIKPTVLQAIFDCLCPSGVGPVTVGYQCTQKKVKTMTPALDALGDPIMKPVPALEQVGAALGVMAPPMPEPLMVEVEVPITIHERWFVSRFSPKALLIPASFRDTIFTRAPWLGKEWRKPTSQVIREYGLAKDWTGTLSDESEKPYFENAQTETTEESAGDPYVTGVELYYRKQIRAKEDVHPEALVKLVLVDGKNDPIKHEDCPYQTFDEKTGEMTRDSIRGFVDRPLVLRDLSDSAWIPSDCAVTGQLTKELDKYRGQILQNRDGNKQVIAFDAGKVDPAAKDKIINSHGVTWVPVQEGTLAGGIDSVIKQVAQPTLGRETYIGQDYIEKDREQILGIGANQVGVQAKGQKTATEQTIVQRNSEARFEQERQRVLEWFLDVVSAFDTLVIRYADERIATQILGEVRGTLWAQYKGALAGGYSYTLQADSGKYLDIEADRRQVLQKYNILRKDPFVNPRVLLRQVAEKFGDDPAEFIVEPQKPDKELKAAISIKGEDLNPLSPAFAIMVSLARQGGWNISEDDVRLAQQQAQGQSGGMMPVSGVGPHPQKGPAVTLDHPGAQEKAPTINQHQMDESGQRSGPRVGAA